MESAVQGELHVYRLRCPQAPHLIWAVTKDEADAIWWAERGWNVKCTVEADITACIPEGGIDEITTKPPCLFTRKPKKISAELSKALDAKPNTPDSETTVNSNG